MSDLWPQVVTDPELDGLKGRTAELLPGARLIVSRHGLDGRPVEHVQKGSLPVFFVGADRVLKLYPPRDREDFGIESRTLAFLDGKLAAPRLIASGDLDGWGYLLMTRLGGVALEEAWDEIPARQRSGLAEEIGLWLAELHGLSTAGLDLELSLGPWPRFLEGRYAIATEEQARFGLTLPWLEQIDDYLSTVAVQRQGPTVLLHTEVTREHVFVEQRSGVWRLAGLLDYEPAMLGAPEYEFASVGVFTSCGDAEFLRRLLLAYGYAPSDLDHGLQRRLMAYTLLHRYTCLAWYLRRMPPEPGVQTLEQLARQWWRLDT